MEKWLMFTSVMSEEMVMFVSGKKLSLFTSVAHEWKEVVDVREWKEVEVQKCMIVVSGKKLKSKSGRYS